MKKSPLPIPRKSFRLNEIAARNSFSLGFIYKQINAGRLRVRKAGSATIVTAEDEVAWLEAMPSGLQQPAHLSESRAKRVLQRATKEEKDEHNDL
jgi:hypothetical protein